MANGSKRSKLKKALSPLSSSPPEPEKGDTSLLDDLFAQLDAKSAAEEQEKASKGKVDENTPPVAKQEKQDSKSRFKAREARKAAAAAANYSKIDPEADARLEKEARDEERDINRICDQLGLEMYEINPDGHCLFSAVADQLTLLGILPRSAASYVATRRAAASYMRSHPNDFLPFLPSVEGEDGQGATDDTGLMGPQQFERYCAIISSTAAWGGEPEILALSRAYKIPIHVVQAGQPPVVVHDPNGNTGDDLTGRAVRISYHRRMYGLGEHYNSLRPKASSREQISNAIRSVLR